MSHINFINYLLEYSDTLLYLYLEKNEKNSSEFRHYVSSLIKKNQVCSNVYGLTRCYTTTMVLENIMGIGTHNKLFENNTCFVPLNNGVCEINDMYNKIIEESKLKNLIRVDITPDHVFYLLKSNDSWYLISSWIYLYSLNCIKINFEKFMKDFLLFFYQMKNKKTNLTGLLDNSYMIFLAKYFMYKTSVHNNSIFISNDIHSVRESLDSDFIKTDYYGKDPDGNHECGMEFYNANSTDISFLKSNLLSNVLMFVSDNWYTIMETNNLKINDYKKILDIGVKQWLLENDTVKSKNKYKTDNEKIYFDEQLDILYDIKNIFKKNIIKNCIIKNCSFR